MHFSMGIARGFQSIPIAYGDTTLRKPEKVSGVLKGLEVGSKELAYGFYDGIAGLVTQPMRGANGQRCCRTLQGSQSWLKRVNFETWCGAFWTPRSCTPGREPVDT